jgi:hypothetical protein
MRKTLLSAVAVATILSAGLFASRAAATPSAVPATAMTAANALTREASIVCGSNGCGVVPTKATKQRKLIWLGHG